MVKLPEPVFYLDRFLGEIRQISPSQPLDKYPASFFDHPGLHFYMLPWAQQAAYYHETYDRILDLPTSNPEGLAIGAFPVRSDASDVLEG